ncbi:polyprenol monophosphomannose synthase [Naasia aerilata]|uniref:Dolichol-phosphate mannosyltransferase n=1 Tax=Naasia aerilata TaxID=1162966 RepID=A0ABM8GC94_9MICO|nr:polyprenol monophosphomannose synthase [Naasia aerilata]BDZ45877.1 dolichol-phosphate mannosyltransferase [Naasia aerilata]
MPRSANTPPRGRALVVIPTYNEIANLDAVVRRVLDLNADLDILVVDDSSPDGTGELADRLAAEESRVSVLHRAGKEGLGRAYLSGFHRAMVLGYPAVVELDADGSHPTASLPAMMDALEADPSLGVVIGSRWVPGGTVVDWSPFRQLLSRAGNTYARWMLSLPVRDSTAGYRAYRTSALDALPLRDVHSRGYCFQIDMTIRLHDAGFGISEFPIEFRERTAGTSKMNNAIVLEAMARVTVWGVERRLRAVLRRLRAVAPRLRSR